MIRLEQFPVQGPTAVALGNFDGVHLGHRTILENGIALARREGMKFVVWTFREHPQKLLSPAHFSGDVMSAEQKYALLEEMGVDALCLADFCEVRDLSPEDFCQRILITALSARAVFCGFNFRFGKNGQGDAAFLKTRLAPHGIRVFVEEPVCLLGDVVSSSRIRTLLSEGDMASAAALLGRPYTVSLPVLSGKREGRRMGWPTINQKFPPYAVLPRRGVYAVRVDLEGKLYDGVCNVGVRPTFDDGDAVTAETHVLDYSGDLYGKVVRVEFLRYLREEIPFSSPEELARQIALDRDEVRAKREESK